MVENLDCTIDYFEYTRKMRLELKDALFSELSKYSSFQLATYFNDGITRANTNGVISREILPPDADHRRELVHDYLFHLPKTFRAKFRANLDDEVKRSQLLSGFRIVPSGFIPLDVSFSSEIED